MGIFDFFKSGSPEEQAAKLKPKITQKYGDPTVRQKAIEQVADLRCEAGVAVLLHRFVVTVDPQTTDAEEKERTFKLIVDHGDLALTPIHDFLKRTDHASSWALKLLLALKTEAQVVDDAVALLTLWGAEYTRDPEKKIVLIQFLERKDPAIVGATLTTFLDDVSDEVRLAALHALSTVPFEPARERILSLLTAGDTAKRVQAAALNTVCELGLPVQGYRERVEALLVDPWFIDRSGNVKKRGAA